MLKNKIDLAITYFPTTLEKNRICGHTFEVLDYYLFFKFYHNINAKIIIFENLKLKDLKLAYYDKIDEEYYYLLDNLFKNDLIFKPKNKIFGLKILCTSDFYKFLGFENLYFKDWYTFLCSKKHVPFERAKILADSRIYNKKYKQEIKHYVKKIAFKFYKKIKKTENKSIIYLNSHLRNISIDKLLRYQENYSNLKFIAGNILPEEYYKKFDIWQAPMPNLFEKFNTYIYTPTKYKFDCSPRFLLESKLYNKKIIFDLDESFEEYTKKDKGLYWRWYDIQNNANSLILNKNDDIIKLMDL